MFVLGCCYCCFGCVVYICWFWFFALGISEFGVFVDLVCWFVGVLYGGFQWSVGLMHFLVWWFSGVWLIVNLLLLCWFGFELFISGVLELVVSWVCWFWWFLDFDWMVEILVKLSFRVVILVWVVFGLIAFVWFRFGFTCMNLVLWVVLGLSLWFELDLGLRWVWFRVVFLISWCLGNLLGLMVFLGFCWFWVFGFRLTRLVCCLDISSVWVDLVLVWLCCLLIWVVVDVFGLV